MAKTKPPVISEERAEKVAATKGFSSLNVYDKDGQFVRTYSLEVHGEAFQTLAEDFVSAEKNRSRGYTIRKY